jgi:ribosomal protein S18 acetylase RimI-like enzyme
MDALLAEASRAGAERSYLQVECGNASAEALYDGLGYREVYRYWYRKQIPAGT